VSDLVQRSFNAFVASDWSSSARATFLAESSSVEVCKSISAAWHTELALSEQALVGFVLMPRPNILAALFVDPGHVRRGFGRALWERARKMVEAQHPDVDTVEVNATPWSTPFYRAMGFAAISAPFEHKGARVTRMACWLPARGLEAELR
jgi:GNAT superfamily N-acetyltransferase